MTKVAIVQSNYIPWKGYFDLIASVDAFVVYDDVQFTKNDWRNRNRIKTPQGVQWLTIPVSQGNDQRICDVRVTDKRWQAKHWKAVAANYARAPHFKAHEAEVRQAYEAAESESLSAVNTHFIESINAILGIETQMHSVLDMDVSGDRIERLVDICKLLGADTYVSGPAARAYLDETPFEEAGITVEWFDYSGYPTYAQPWGDFEHGVTILDAIFSCGASQTRDMLGR
ncbi:MAG: WbqC family protein [Pseudomonadota bacterium]